MRLLVITELYLPTKGGTAVWFDEVYRRLGGKEIHVVTADVPGAGEHDLHHPNTVHRVRLQRHWWLRPESLAMYAKLLWRAINVALANNIDAVHAGRVLPEGLVGWLVARLARVPLVIYAHGEEITGWRNPKKFRVMRFVYRHADVAVANSEFTRDELLKLDVSPERIVLINPGVDIQRFKPGLDVAGLRTANNIPEQANLILSVGRLSRRKGFDHTVQALATLVMEGMDAHYAIIGIGEDRDYLNTLASQSGVANRIHFLGHVPPEDLPRWYNASDVFVMPNREIGGDTEGFGIVFIEAAACGKPAIGGRAGGTGAAIQENVTGLRVNGGSVEQIAEALKSVLTNPVLADRLGMAGLKRVQRELSWDEVANRTRAMLSCDKPQ